MKIGTIIAIDSAGAVSAPSGANLEVGNIYVENCGFAVNVHPDPRVFELADLIEQSDIINKPEAQQALYILSNPGPEDKVSAYNALVASMANHMTILSPFLPMLAALAGINAS
jgi:hypothetical protein